jgi:hypothetical protein
MLFKGKGLALGRFGIYLLWSVCFLQAALVHCNEHMYQGENGTQRAYVRSCSLEPNLIYDLTLKELQKKNYRMVPNPGFYLNLLLYKEVSLLILCKLNLTFVNWRLFFNIFKLTK